MLGVGAGVVIAGLAYYGNQQVQASKKSGLLSDVMNDAANNTTSKANKFGSPEYLRNAKRHDAEMAAIFGPGPGSAERSKMYMGEGFYTGLMNKKALDRPEFTLPKSTIFQRLSDAEETGQGYNRGTYATFLTNDNKAYGNSFEFGNKAHTLNFSPKEDVKVPSLRTVLDTVKELGDGSGRKYSDDEAFSAYHTMAGGDWHSGQNARLIEGLKKKGYSAIVDDMDAGFYGDLPMVFFGETEKVTAKPRTWADWEADGKGIVSMTGRYA